MVNDNQMSKLNKANVQYQINGNIGKNPDLVSFYTPSVVMLLYLAYQLVASIIE